MTWSVGAIGLGLGVLTQIVGMVWFFARWRYHTERLDGELHTLNKNFAAATERIGGRIDKLAERSESIAVIRESVRSLEDRLKLLESRAERLWQHDQN